MNYREFNDPIFGVQSEDIIIEDSASIDELNTRIQSRHFSDNMMQPYFTPRPTPTKYSRFPMIERRSATTVPIKQYDIHSPATNFNPGTRPYAFGSYLANYGDEVNLRQPMNRLDENAVYLPHSNSEMYKMRVPECKTRNEEQTHPLLFERPAIRGRTVHPDVSKNMGNMQFMNASRLKHVL